MAIVADRICTHFHISSHFESNQIEFPNRIKNISLKKEKTQYIDNIKQLLHQDNQVDKARIFSIRIDGLEVFLNPFNIDIAMNQTDKSGLSDRTLFANASGLTAGQISIGANQSTGNSHFLASGSGFIAPKLKRV